MIKTPPSNPSSRDGWERTFGQGIPDMNKEVRDMLHGWLKSESYRKIHYFFVGHCDYTEEYAGFLLRELMRGNI